MPVVETEAVILRTYRLAEADKIVVALTKAAGVVRGVARGARRVKSRFGASLEPWTICDLAYFEKENRDLVSINSAEIKRSAFALSRDAGIVGALEYMGELALEFLPPHEPNPNMFRMVKACGEAAHLEMVDVRRLIEYFEVWTLRLGGFLPSFRLCAECRTSLAPERRFVVDLYGVARCGDCAAGAKSVLGAEAFGSVQAIQRLSPAEYIETSTEDSDKNGDTGSQTELRALLQRLIVRALEREPRAGRRFLLQNRGTGQTPQINGAGEAAEEVAEESETLVDRTEESAEELASEFSTASKASAASESAE